MKRGFTLVEILLTLGIVGVVAALTIPNVMKDYKKRLYVTQLQKVYNQLSNQAKNYMQDNSLTSLYPEFNPQQFFSKYFNVIKGCGTDLGKCFASQYVSLDGTQTYNSSDFVPNFQPTDGSGNSEEFPFFCGIINTGSSICISKMSSDYYENGELHSHGYSKVIVDLNGKDRPNTKGRDYYQFYLYSDGKVAETYDKTSSGYLQSQENYDRAQRCEENLGGYADSCFDRITSDGWTWITKGFLDFNIQKTKS